MLHQCIRQQREIVQSMLPLLAPRGRLVYGTCSVLSDENDKQVDHLTAVHRLRQVDEPFRSLPSVNGMDGMFGAVLERIK
jgi:16S rRNA C967 or C1407 C5-methylase (RsmB/RsmF family)